MTFPEKIKHQIKDGDLKAIKRYLNNGGSYEIDGDDYLYRLLDEAIFYNQLDIINYSINNNVGYFIDNAARLLFKATSDFRHVARGAQTFPSFSPTLHVHAKTVELLIMKGAPVNCQCEEFHEYRYPLDIACAMYKPVLKKYGAKTYYQAHPFKRLKRIWTGGDNPWVFLIGFFTLWSNNL